MFLSNTWYVKTLSHKEPAAFSEMRGDSRFPNLHGLITFTPIPGGTLLTAEFTGLPSSPDICATRILGFHIHEGSECTGTPENPFANAKGHFNPMGCQHPMHAGDLPPIFANNGYAFMALATYRFCVNDVIGRTVILHENPDDFKSQPSGNAGPMIACGKILAAPENPQRSSR